MNALFYSEPLEIQDSQRVTPLRRSRSPHVAMTAEITVKVVVNGILSTAAIAALINLLPYHLSQQAKLREVRSEVKHAQMQVNQLREDLNHSFDPQQSKRVMQEQSGRVDPNQRNIVWVEKDAEVSGY